MGIFTKRERPVPPAAEPSVAESLGISPPPLTREHKAGLEAAARINANQSNARLAQYEAQREARRQAEAARDDLIWRKVLDRQRNVIG